MVRLISFARPFLPPRLLALFLGVLGGVLFVAGSAAGQPLTMTAGLKLSSTYRTDCWQPIHLEFRNDGPMAIEGSAVVPLTDPQAPAAMVLPVTVPSHARLKATIWAYLPPLISTPEQMRKGPVPPLVMAEFRGRDGALLTRAEVVGIPISRSSGDQAADEDQRGELILVVGQREMEDESYEGTWLVAHLGDALGAPMAVAKATLDRFPRQPAGLRSIKAVVLEGVDPESLDLAQRTALLDYLHGGGVVVVAAPIPSVARAGSWLEAHFPVRLTGSRMARQVETSPGGKALKFREWLPIAEAVDGGGDVLLRDRDYVHVATKSVGLGTVVFTSFPINGLMENQPQVAALWEQLLGMRRPLWDWRDSQLGETRHRVLSAMIGRKVAPWRVAAAIAGGYVLLVALAQAMFLGPARPKAFIAAGAVAVVLSGALLAMGMARRGETGLQGARLAIVDLAADGNGWQQESLAYVGAADPKMALRAADELVMIRPALSDDGDPPRIRQQPFAVDNSGIYAERIERVWEASGPADPKWRIGAVGMFGPAGFTLEVDNGIGLPLRAPLIVWQGAVVSMDDLPAGLSATRSFQLNNRGDFTTGGMLTSDEAKRRALIIKSSLLPAKRQLAQTADAETPPMLVAWLPAAPRELIQLAEPWSMTRKSMVMVRTPLRIEPSAVGKRIEVSPEFVSADTGRLPYDHANGESIPTPQPGQWQINFSVPPQIGRIRPTQLILSVRVTLPAHRLHIRTRTLPGPVVTWSRELGAKEVAIDCSPGDYDESGRVHLTIEVEALDMTSNVPWQISDLGASIGAEVVGPPMAIVLDAPGGAGRSSENSR